MATKSKCSLTREQRRGVCNDTIARSSNITAEHAYQGATLDSTFIAKQLPPLPPAVDANSHTLNPNSVQIINLDAFTLARQLMEEDPEHAIGKTAVLNLASDIKPGGGWNYILDKTQASLMA